MPRAEVGESYLLSWRVRVLMGIKMCLWEPSKHHLWLSTAGEQREAVCLQGDLAQTELGSAGHRGTERSELESAGARIPSRLRVHALTPLCVDLGGPLNAQASTLPRPHRPEHSQVLQAGTFPSTRPHHLSSCFSPTPPQSLGH